MTDTIFALASGVGRAGIAVWRLSGPQTAAMVQTLAGKLPKPRMAHYGQLTHPNATVIDKGLILWFPGPASFTGEDMAEFQIHGGHAMARSINDALLALGARLAEPGEFTRRAVLNGKMDLTVAEGIIDLVDADTERQRQQALHHAGGALAQQVDQWRQRLVSILGYVEATIDFAEEDIPDLMPRIGGHIQSLLSEWDHALACSQRGERLRQGLAVAILGAPNAGKSSLLNQLAGREAAIVSHHAGTTRDVIEVELDLNGWPVILFDTAGLRDASDHVEQEGIRRARQLAERADINMVVFDGTDAILDSHSLGLLDARSLVVVNKMDQAQALPSDIGGHSVVGVSAASGQGIDALLQTLALRAESSMSGEQFAFGRARHRAALMQAAEALRFCDLSGPVELAAEEVRRAVNAIGRITGVVLADDILDVVFREFCIGK